MKPIFTILAGIALLCLPAQAGTITGRVTAHGKEGASEGGDSGKYDSRKLKFVERLNYASLKDFVVFIEGKVDSVTNNTPKNLSEK